MKEKIKVNKHKLWIIFGFAWLLPQIILLSTPENYHWIKIPILIFSGILIVFTNVIERWILK